MRHSPNRAKREYVYKIIIYKLIYLKKLNNCGLVTTFEHDFVNSILPAINSRYVALKYMK